MNDFPAFCLLNGSHLILGDWCAAVGMSEDKSDCMVGAHDCGPLVICTETGSTCKTARAGRLVGEGFDWARSLLWIRNEWGNRLGYRIESGREWNLALLMSSRAGFHTIL
jgi:hypothetical protein